jgi:polycomb-like protein 2
LAKNVKHFKCGKEIKKRTTIWALREDAPLNPPPISLPKNVPVNDTLLKDNNKTLKFLPPTFKSLASGKSYLFNGQRENTPVPSMIHIMERNGLSSSCSSDTDSKRDNVSSQWT